MKIQVCTGKMCKSRFSEYIIKRIESDIEKFKIQNISLEACPCLWSCKTWPNVVIDWKIEKYCEWAKISKIILDKINQRKNTKNDINN